MAHLNGNQFRPEEIICLRHYDKKTGTWSESEYPKVGGRLRLAHEVNGNLDINTEIIRYDSSLAVVRAVISSDKGSFSGIGMASVERDAKLAPAVLELSETRAIARALRFAGFGVEYCSAEEISHLEQEASLQAPDNSHRHQPQENPSYQSAPPRKTQPDDRPRNGNGQGVSGGNGENGNGNGNGNNGRISQKQHSFLLSLADDRNVSRKELDDMSKERFGVVVNFLTKTDASSFIGELTGN
jgi:hypothetical protein